MPDEAAPIDLAADGSDRAGIGVRLDNASRQMDTDELTLTDVLVGGVRSPILAGGPSGVDSAVVFVHGNPGSGRDWGSLMAEVSRFARCVAPDMPGYGGADKPEDFDYTTEGYARYLGALLDELAVRRAHLVLHDIGGAWGLAWAAAHPTALASVSLINIGSLPGYRWHRFARLYRRPVLGEMLLAGINRPGLALLLRRGNPRGLPGTFIDGVVRQYRDARTRRAVLRFYRATPDLGAVTERAAVSLRSATRRRWSSGERRTRTSKSATRRCSGSTSHARRSSFCRVAATGHTWMTRKG